jgi:hypothetical protein
MIAVLTRWLHSLVRTAIRGYENLAEGEGRNPATTNVVFMGVHCGVSRGDNS